MSTNQQTKRRTPAFQQSLVEAVAAILGDTDNGLTNAEIEKVLAAIGLPDPRKEAEAAYPWASSQGLAYVSLTKRERISQAVLRQQTKQKDGQPLVAFIREAMKPDRFIGKEERFRFLQSELNQVLVLEGLKVNDKGQVARGKKAQTLSEAARIAGELTTELRRREAHPAVLQYCTEELVAKDLFHAVHEAVKGLCDRLRSMAGTSLDGQELVGHALGSSRNRNPVVWVNSLSTETERNEQNGLALIARGLVSRYRNPTAHETRIRRDAENPYLNREALEVFTSLSLVHHALDGATAANTEPLRAPS